MNPFSIYFPQFYPTPTNDHAWGKGFTDWSLVANANMRDLWLRRAPARGFYDGSSREAHLAQMREAEAAGVGGFGVYHYWFYSHQELGAFERTLMESPAQSRMPWFLIWASEGWSRRWMGDPTELVSLSKDPDQRSVELHADYLARCFEDRNYFRVDGRPLFAWYNLGHFQRPEALIDQYRRCWQARGIYVHAVQFIKMPFDVQYAAFVDGSYLFEPRLFFSFKRPGKSTSAKHARDLLSRVLGERMVARLLVTMDRLAVRGETFRAEEFLRYLRSPERAQWVTSIGGDVQEVLSPGWNNAPRYGARFTALENLSVDEFVRLLTQPSASEKLPALINAWNEWSEGAAIEPCAYLGRRYLDAVRSSIDANSEQSTCVS